MRRALAAAARNTRNAAAVSRSSDVQKSDSRKSGYVLGVISDTHGLLRPEVAAAFKNVDMVLHAGDIGGPEILEALERVAPVAAVRGNMDHGTWAFDLPEYRRITLGDTGIFLIHDLFGFHLEGDGGVQVVISGHTHRPHIERRSNVLYLNPGSAGYGRRLYPVSVALLTIEGRRVDAGIVPLAG